jgi:hypothetical protein
MLHKRGVYCLDNVINETEPSRLLYYMHMQYKHRLYKDTYFHQGDLALTIIEPLVSVLLNEATDVIVEAWRIAC